jgi:hypothetical protein
LRQIHDSVQLPSTFHMHSVIASLVHRTW